MASLAWVLLVCSLLSCLGLDKELHWASAQTEPVTYKVPDPFKSQAADKQYEFYSLRSVQSTFTAHRQSTKLVVEEYFSLGEGLTYSVHRAGKQGRVLGQSWAIIGDSKHAKWYIVLNPDSSDEDEFDCELDHTHNHRQVFPWQYVYDLSSATPANNSTPSAGLLPVPADGPKAKADKKDSKGKGKAKAKAKTTKKTRASIYGVGAIWLNAIKGDVRSSLVGDFSPYAWSNSWFLEANNLRVELVFDKPPKKGPQGDAIEIQKQLDATPLSGITIERKHLLVPGSHVDPDGTSVADHHTERIVVDKFRSGLNLENSPEILQRIYVQLELCRRAYKRQRVFPSLLRSLSTSAQRAYKIEYTTRHLPLFKDGHAHHSGGFDDAHHRYLFPVENTTEVFSLAEATETILYDPVPVHGESYAISRTDVFMSRFTEHAHLNSSSRHSTAYYHVIVSDDAETCNVGEREPHPQWGLFVRLLNFHRSGSLCRGRLRGLGALLMNVADMHYRSFSLTTKTIEVALDSSEPNEKQDVEVDEWRVEDARTGWTIHFYIQRRDKSREPLSMDLSERARADLARLVRIDVRNNKANDVSDDVIASSGEDQNDDYNLVLQYTIFEFGFELTQEEEEIFLRTPGSCALAHQDQTNGADSSDDDDESDYDDSNEYNEYIYDTDTDTDSENNENEEHEADEQFDFEPGQLEEGFPMPDFFEFLEDQASYEFTTKLELIDHDDDDGHNATAPHKRKHIWLRELVHLDREAATLSIFTSDERLHRNDPDELYYIFYESELVFRAANNRCQHLESMEDAKWLRLFSAQLVYHTVPNLIGRTPEPQVLHNKMVAESSKLSWFGVGALWRRASESAMTEFLGRRREILDRDGRQYKQLVWALEEFDMTIRFNFLLDFSSHQENEFKRPHQTHLPNEHLSLDSITITNKYGDDYVASQFKQVQARVQSLNLGPFDKLLVPEVCRDQFVEAQRMREQVEARVKPPSFLELLGAEAQAYQLSYTVTHSRVSQSESSSKASVWHVTESFDRAQNRGKVVVKRDNEWVEIFIDGKNKQLLAYSASLGRCAPINSLRMVLKSLLGDFMAENENFEADQLHGLAGLLMDLSSREANMRVSYYLDRQGRKLETRTYYLELANKVESGPDQLHEVQMGVHMERSSRDHFDPASKVKIRAGERPMLRTLRLSLLAKSGRRHEPRQHVNRIYIDEQLPYIKDEWTLPQACVDLNEPATGESGNATKVTQGFPRISDRIIRTNRFHMKSEVSIQGGLKKAYLLDEWVHNGHFRMRSHGMGKAGDKNFDFIFYNDTREQFDLSARLKCQSGHWPENALELDLGAGLESNLLGVWTDSSTQINHLANLYYGPLTMWLMAEKSRPDQLNMFKTLEIKPLELASGDAFLEHLARAMNTEVWRVSAPKSSPHKWSFDMEFTKYSREVAPDHMLTWHALESVRLEDLGTGGGADKSYKILIDVANYNYQPKDEDLLELFRLPEGWNCRRNARALEQLSSLQDFAIDWEANWLLTYEASLEVVSGGVVEDDLELGPIRVDQFQARPLPTLSGLYMKSDPRRPNQSSVESLFASLVQMALTNVDLSVHRSQTRFLNGSSQLSKLVTDRARPIEFELDDATGACSVKALQNSGWQLKFAEDEKRAHTVSLLGSNSADPHPLFKQLFMDVVNEQGEFLFAPINKYTSDGRVVHTTYEREFDSLRLTNTFNGPARVVRKFDHTMGRASLARRVAHGTTPKLIKLGERKMLVDEHDFISVRVYSLANDKTTLRAIFDITLQMHPPAHLSDFLSSASVYECFNEGDPQWDRPVGHFSLEYPTQGPAMQLAAGYYVAAIQDGLYANLLRSTRLLPLQLDGQAHVELAPRDNLLRVHFNVLEAPTSHVYFTERIQCSMSARVESVSEWRLVPSLAECSRWCDHINCVAMSYCSDFSCRVATKAAIFGPERGSRSSKPMTGDQLAVVSACDAQVSCSYYFNREGLRTRTLSSFKDLMELTVNTRREPMRLDLLSLNLSIYTRIRPNRFYESSELFRWQGEDSAGLHEADLDAQPSYGRVRSGQLIDATKLEQLNERLEQEGGSRFSSKSSLANSLLECLQQCEHHSQGGDCLLASYCKRSRECVLVTASDTATIASGLQELKRATFGLGASGCSISIRDHLGRFSKFEDSRAPSDVNLPLDGFSALECAAACQSARDECLSFDLCTYTDVKSTPALTEQGDGQPLADSQSVCFLQKSHVTLDSFDRSLLLPSWDTEQTSASRNRVFNRSVVCDHYSKSLLVDFKRLANKRIAQKMGSAITGINSEKCAVNCLQDDECRAFEFCQNERRWPAQSCYLIRSDELLAGDHSKGDANTDTLNKLLANSSSCSVYVTKATAMRARLNQTLEVDGAGESPTDRSTSPRRLTTLAYMLLAILTGALFQVVYIKLMGRPVLIR